MWVGKVGDQPVRARRESDIGDSRSTTGRDDVRTLAHRLLDEHATQGAGGTRDHNAEALDPVRRSTTDGSGTVAHDDFFPK